MKMVKCRDLKCELVIWKWLSVETWNVYLLLENGSDLKMCICYLKMVKCSDLKCELVAWNLLSVLTWNVY